MSRHETQPVRTVLVVGFSFGGVDAEILRGFNLYRRNAGKWIIQDAGHGRQWLDRFLESNQRFSGVLANVSDPELADRLGTLDLPVVDCSSLLKNRPFPRVTADNQKVGEMAAKYFESQPFREYLFVSNEARLFEQKRWEGFVQRLSEKDIHPRWIVLDTLAERPPDAEIAPKGFTSLLNGLDRPIAVFAASDRVGMSVCDFARRAGLSIPGDLTVLGVDDVEALCDSCDPTLSSIRLPGEQIGFEAGRRLEEAIKGNREADAILLPPVMVHSRASTDPGAGDSEVARAIRYMREHLGEHLHIKDIAQQLHMHPRTFLRHFQREVGRNPHEELLRMQIEEASRQLLQTEEPIYMIAEACGFGDADQLTRHFKKATSLTPSQFRSRSHPASR